MRTIQITEFQQTWVEFPGQLQITDEEFKQLENGEISIQDLKLDNIQYNNNSTIGEELINGFREYEYN